MRYLISGFILLFLSYCAPQITRTGYSVANGATKDCEVVIKENAEIDASIGQVIGEIDVDDSGFSVDCGEQDVMLILKREACALGADIINLKEIKRPNLMSSCFRVKAELIRLNDSISKDNIQTSEEFDEERISEREKEDSRRQTSYFVGAVVVGLLVGFYSA